MSVPEASVSEPFNACAWLLDRHLTEGHGDHLAVVCEGRRSTYRDLLDATLAAANGFASLGLTPGERAILIINDEEAFLAAFLGAMRLGAVPVPLSTMLTAKDHATIAADAQASTVVVSAAYADHLPAIADTTPSLRTAVVVGDAEAELASATVHRWADFTDTAQRPPASTSTDSPAFWLYTSGTTGTPKGAIHTHGNLRVTAETYARSVLEISEADRCYSVAKLFFAYGLGNSLTFPFSVGATTILDPRRPTPATVMDMLSTHRPTLFFASPGFCAAMLDAGLPPDALAGARLVVTAGESLPAQLSERFVARFGVPVLDGIGTTEALHIFCSNHLGAVRPGTSGTPVTGYELKLVDDGGSEVVEPDVPGYLHVRGGSLAAGYWSRPDATRAAFEGGWLRTGDVYVRSSDDYWRFLGRNNDMIKAGGIWVSPAEVEGVLVQHDDVLEAAVVGDRDADGLETVVAFVVARSGHTVDRESLVVHSRSQMAAFKRPRRIIVVDELPKTATGKVQRFALRDSLRAEHAP